MQITELKVTIGEVCEGYINDAEEGVVGYDERLDIRPKYQREFVYKDKQRDEVIRTVMKGLPLNVIYWCKVKKEDGSDGFEVLDGQQRTISVCEYVDGTFSVDDKYFYNLPSDKQKQILDYPLFVYVCDGTDSEKLDWFRIVQGLLCCKAQQAVGIPLERSEVIERRWIFGLFLARDFLDRGHHLLSALRKQLFRVRFFRNAAA